MATPNTPPKPVLAPDVFVDEARKEAGDPNITAAAVYAKKKSLGKNATAKQVGASLKSEKDSAALKKKIEKAQKAVPPAPLPAKKTKP